MRKTLHLFLALSGIALASGLVLGSLHDATAQLVADNILRFKKIPALVAIYESIQGGEALIDDERAALEEKLLSSPRLLDVGATEQVTVYLLEEEKQSPTVVVEGFGQGYGGKLGVMVGIELGSAKLSGVGITTLSETPGLGTRVREPAFTRQFVGLSTKAKLMLKKDGGELDAVSGATKSSRAVASAVRQVSQLYNEHHAAIEAVAKKKP